MPAYPPEFIEKVRQANNIVDLIGQYTQLRGHGANYMGRCPFPNHNDKTASFSVSEDKQLFNCFGCKQSGNIFKFLQIYNGMAFREAVDELARRANIPLPEKPMSPREREEAQTREGVLTANKLARSYFRDQFQRLPEDHPVKAYAAKRGLTAEILETFEIGYAPPAYQGLVSELQARKIPLRIGERAGLMRPSNRPGAHSHYDLFRHRLMFPIVAANGDVLGFGGRVLDASEPKYLNSPETPVFSKGKTLYGLNVTARHIRSEDEAIIVEGYMDAVALYRGGVRHVAAILGTAFTMEHGRVLSRLTANVTMLLDGDEAGIRGAERSLPALLASGLRPKGLILPEGMDPDDFLAAKGPEELRRVLAGGQDLFSILLARHWMASYRATAQDKLRVIEAAAQALLPVGPKLMDMPIIGLFADEMARYLDVESAWVRNTLRSALESRLRRQPQSGGEAADARLGAESASKLRPTVGVAGGLTGGVTGASGDEDLRGSSGELEQAEAAELSRAADERIDLDGMVEEEKLIVGLLLQSRYLMQDLHEASREWAKSGRPKEEHPIAVFLDHAGARKLVGIALRRYGHEPAGFATLSASLWAYLKQPDQLASALAAVAERGWVLESSEPRELSGPHPSVKLQEDPAQHEKDRQRMNKLFTAIQKRRAQLGLQKLSLSLKQSPDPEQSKNLMEEFIRLQMELRRLEQELHAPDPT
ncbi:MAG TPA: DNA primase [Pseudobdellovibrionaceae bacterium]|nr:DNA primase [Pseudobdellovibrionaceae bacterium]